MKKIVLILIVMTNLAMYAQYDFSEVERILEDSIEVIAGFGKGASLVLIKDGQTIYDKSFNVKGESSYSSKKVVPIASASKWLSAGVIMKLVDDGRLSLDDTLGKFYPNLTSPKSSITIRQLFSHTSGMLASEDEECLSDKSSTLEDCANKILELDLASNPGQFFAYGGLSMQVAGRIAEIASGIKMQSGYAWNSLFDNYIKSECNMPNTRYNLNPLTESTNPRIGGGVYSNATDYANFLSMLIGNGKFNGNQVLSSNSVKEMLKDQTNNAPIAFSPHTKYTYLSDGKTEYKYGIGNWREQSISNNERFESSSQGALGFSPWIDYDRNMVGVLSVFSDLETVMPTYVKLKKSIRETIDKPASVKERPKNVKALAVKITPNPVNSKADISFYLPKSGEVTLKIYNILGNEIDTLIDKNLTEGEHNFSFDFSTYPASLYIYKFKYNDYFESNKFYISR